LETSRVAKGTTYIAVQNVIQYLVAFVFYVVIARLLSQAEVGEISLLFFCMGVFGTLTQLAMPVATQKFVSENLGKGQIGRASAVSKTALKILLATSTPSLLLVIFTSKQLSLFVFGTEANIFVLIIAFITAFILNFTALFGAEMLGLGLFAEMAAQNLTFVILGKMMAIIFAWLGYGVNGVIMGWLLGSIICLIVSYIILRGKSPKPNEVFPAKMIITYSYPVLIFAIFGLIQGWADVTILYALTTSLAATGVYYLTMAGATTLSIIWTAITTTIFPALSTQYGKTGFAGLEKNLLISTRLLNLLVIPLSISLAAISQTAIIIAYGPSYLLGALPFALLTSTSIIAAYAALFTVALQAIGETRALIKIGATSALTDLVIVTLLARPLGVVGAAIARIAMFSIALVLCYRTLGGKIGQLTLDVGSIKKALLLSATIAIPLALTDWLLLYVIPTTALVRIIIEVVVFVGIGLIGVIKLRLLEAGDFDLFRLGLPKQLHKIINFAEKVLI